ncbi:MAG: RNA polymerase subunit sigma-24, partial [Chloroflexia bacterium]|nr:RNA polymerase subunit sigma-24 [Chloroflexia bacterium]
MSELNDVDLIQSVARGDATALMSLYDRYNRLAFGLAYRILGNPSLAEEAVQDAY